MSRILWRPKFRDGVFSLGVALMVLSLLLFPKQSVVAAGDGVQLCLNVILPSLFVFIVGQKQLIRGMFSGAVKG